MIKTDLHAFASPLTLSFPKGGGVIMPPHPHKPIAWVCAIRGVNFGSDMVHAKNVSGKNTFCSMHKNKISEERIFEIRHYPFEGLAKLHHLCQPNGLVSRC